MKSKYGLMDNLTYTYTGNRLTKVTDAVTTSITNAASFHFVDGANVANEYAYDANGNIVKDLNKNITSITYNSLNLPNVITFGDGNTATYVYDGAGNKLSVAYKSGTVTTKMDYAGNKVYNIQQRNAGHNPHRGGVCLSGSTPTYYYYLKDHQGNNRVLINQAGAVQQVNHYYAFGGLFGEGLQSSGQPYKYNGKELDTKIGLNMYDYGARHYDAALGRWFTVDPLAEKYYGISPYVYCNNNPVRYIDPDGMDVKPIGDEALRMIQNTLTKEDMQFIRLDKNGFIDKEYFNSHKSESGNFNSLSELVNSDILTEVSLGDSYSYMDKNGNMQTREMSYQEADPDFVDLTGSTLTEQQQEKRGLWDKLSYRGKERAGLTLLMVQLI